MPLAPDVGALFISLPCLRDTDVGAGNNLLDKMLGQELYIYVEMYRKGW